MNNLNPVTTFALLVWPAVAIGLYKTRPIAEATLWTLLAAYMLLPVGADIKFKMVPQLDKSSVPNLAALFGCVIVCGTPIRFLNGFRLTELLILTLIISPFITCELNTDPVRVGTQILPGLSSYDAGSAAIAQVITLIPFFLGRQIFRKRADTEEILRVLVIAGLVYTLPALFEIRFSPQLHTWIYGYFPTTGDGPAFREAMRDGGFRPVLFMGHGLLVSFFFSTAAVAAAAFWRTKTQVMPTLRLPSSGITAYLGVVLVLCKSAGSMIYGAILVPLVRFASPKIQLRVAVLLVSVALLYPMLRTAGLIPTDALLDVAQSISIERRDSLETRLINEENLLDRASQRFLFGWGRYGRSFIYNGRGDETSATDGMWIIILGQFGLVGFLAEFGLLVLPVFAIARALRFAETTKDKVFISALALILAINIVDLLPNSSIRPWTWLIAGALLGRAEALRRPAAVKATLASLPPRSPKYPPPRMPSAVK
jgi:hypothetical protein